MVNPKVIEYLYPQALPLTHYYLEDSGNGPFIAFWKTQVLGPQPTEEFLSQTEVSVPYLTWLSEHGGDPVATVRRQAKDILTSTNPDWSALRGALRVVFASLLETRSTLNALIDHVANPRANPRPAKLQNRTWPQVIAAAKQAIANEADPGN